MKCKEADFGIMNKIPNKELKFKVVGFIYGILESSRSPWAPESSKYDLGWENFSEYIMKPRSETDKHAYHY